MRKPSKLWVEKVWAQLATSPLTTQVTVNFNEVQIKNVVGGMKKKDIWTWLCRQ